MKPATSRWYWILVAEKGQVAVIGPLTQHQTPHPVARADTYTSTNFKQSVAGIRATEGQGHTWTRLNQSNSVDHNQKQWMDPNLLYRRQCCFLFFLKTGSLACLDSSERQQFRQGSRSTGRNEQTPGGVALQLLVIRNDTCSWQ